MIHTQNKPSSEQQAALWSLFQRQSFLLCFWKANTGQYTQKHFSETVRSRGESKTRCDTAPLAAWGTEPRPKTQACKTEDGELITLGLFGKEKGTKIAKQLIRSSHWSLPAAVVLTQEALLELWMSAHLTKVWGGKEKEDFLSLPPKVFISLHQQAFALTYYSNT